MSHTNAFDDLIVLKHRPFLPQGLARLVRLRSLSVAAVPAFDDDALTAVCSSCNALRVLNLGSTSVKRAAGLALVGSAMIDLSLAHTK